MIRAGRDLHIDPAHVMSMEWDHRHYANGPGDSVLVVRLATGHTHRIKHQPYYLDGTDAYAVERGILQAKGAANAR